MKILLSLLVLVLGACAHQAENTFKLAPGMSEGAAIEIMGEPTSRYEDKDRQVVRHLYELGNGFGYTHPYEVIFKKGRLVRMHYVRSTGGGVIQFNEVVSAQPQPQQAPINACFPLPYCGYRGR